MTIQHSSRRKGRSAPAAMRAATELQAQQRRQQWMRWLVALGAFVVLVAAVTKDYTPKSAAKYGVETEGFATETIKAEFRFSAPDLAATREAEELAVAKVPDAFNVNDARVNQQLALFDRRVEALRNAQPRIDQAIRAALLASGPDRSRQAVINEAVAAVAAQLAGEPPLDDIDDPTVLIPWLTPAPESVPTRVVQADGPDEPTVAGLEELPAPMQFSTAGRLANVAREQLEYVLAHGVLADDALSKIGRPAQTPDGTPRSIAILRDRLVDDLARSSEHIRDEAPTPSVARGMLRERIRARLAEFGAGESGEALQEAAAQLAQACVGETLVYDAVTTEGLQESARRKVEPVMKVVEKNEPIQLRDARWTEQSRSDYQTMLSLKARGDEQTRTFYSALLANAILVALILLGLMKIIEVLTPDRRDTQLRDLSLTLLVICGAVVIARLVYYIEPTGFVVPATAGAILLTILLNTRIGATTSLMTAVLLSIQYNYDWRLFIVSASMSIAGVLSIYDVRKRSDMGRAAFKATAIGLLAAAAVTLAVDSFVAHGPNRLFLVLFNGVICLFLVPGLLPPLERLFDITTDIQLLEYSDLNNELLSRLAIEVPATYAHSLMLGQLAEAACAAVGANGLLARVCAYYHDIGKLRRPEYFTENQTGANVHDALSPRMSARAIASHVTEGAEMAREFHLPKPMIDAIYEHHGTCRISFFYEQAVAQQKHGGVLEEDFRYPGPRPQSRETAILMICDAVESAVRSLKNPNEERVRELIDKIISSRAEDRQFDECDLTLRDLDIIAEAVTRQILSSMHRRIAYPDRKTAREGTPADNIIRLSEPTESASGGAEP